MNECHISGCRNLPTTCVHCGRIVCTKILPARQEWISVEDRLPEATVHDYNDSWTEDVLVTDGKRIGIGHVGYTREDKVETSRWSAVHEEVKDFSIVTHWMPLPELPKDQNE